jgi:lysophospholipase L1-like esterase
MLNQFKKYSLIALLASGMMACYIEPASVLKPATVPPPSKGTADFTKYIAVGNSLTAGYSDDGYFNAATTVSFPALMATRFAQVGGGAFVQPLFTDAKKDGFGYLRLIGLPNPLPNIQRFIPTTTSAVIGLGADGGTPLLEKYTGDINNLGIPGIRVSDIQINGYGFNNPAGFNPFFERLLPSTNPEGLANYLQFVTAKSAGATFFSCWLGGNDVLIYAARGGDTAIPGTFLTSVADFTTNYTAMINLLTTGGRKGVIATVPLVTNAAHFRTVTLPLLQAAVQAGGGPANATLFIQTGAGTRAATTSDYFTLGAQSDYAKLGSSTHGAGQPFPYGLHPNNPIVTSSVLDADEAAAVVTRTNEFNVVIQGQATAKGLAILDVNALLNQTLSTAGYVSNGIKYTGSFITGGIAALDGVHLSPAGNAIVANEMIKVINAKYGATIPLLNTSLYPGVRLNL